MNRTQRAIKRSLREEQSVIKEEKKHYTKRMNSVKFKYGVLSSEPIGLTLLSKAAHLYIDEEGGEQDPASYKSYLSSCMEDIKEEEKQIKQALSEISLKEVVGVI